MTNNQIKKKKRYTEVFIDHRRRQSLRPAFRWDLHKRLWNILAVTGWDSKGKALQKMRLGRYPFVMCFACEACVHLGNPAFFEFCLCPLNWGNSSITPCLLGLYDQWIDAKTKEERKRIAALIRDLPLSPYARDLYEVIDG